jgi:hypothetical protein
MKAKTAQEETPTLHERLQGTEYDNPRRNEVGFSAIKNTDSTQTKR